MFQIFLYFFFWKTKIIDFLIHLCAHRSILFGVFMVMVEGILYTLWVEGLLFVLYYMYTLHRELKQDKVDERNRFLDDIWAKLIRTAAAAPPSSYKFQ